MYSHIRCSRFTVFLLAAVGAIGPASRFEDYKRVASDACHWTLQLLTRPAILASTRPAVPM